VRKIQRGILGIKAGATAVLHAPLGLLDFPGLGRQLCATDALATDAFRVEIGRVDNQLLGVRTAAKILIT